MTAPLAIEATIRAATQDDAGGWSRVIRSGERCALSGVGE